MSEQKKESQRDGALLMQEKIMDVARKQNLVLLPLPLSGAHREIGICILNACMLAAAERGVGTVNFCVIDAADPDLNVYKLHERFKRADLKAILGPVFFREATQFGALFPQIPIFALSNNRSVNNSHVFACGISPADEIRELCAYANNHGLCDFLALVPKTAFGDQLAEQIIRETDRLGFNERGEVEIVRYSSMSRDDALLCIKNSGKKVVFMIDSLVDPGDVEDVAVFTLGGVALARRDVWKGAFFAFFGGPDMVNFANKYRHFFGKAPGLLEIIAYDLSKFLQILVESGMSEDTLYAPHEGSSGLFLLQKGGGLRRQLEVMQLKEDSESSLPQ
ncbi:MAG: hypothetical protein LBJ16_01100 [Holosporaceae bacterium]|jgi:hypothetical protein|nr:hypothetical protein [Holosporaceae bacterium]